MAFCPGCGYEFREGITHCPDCDMDLVADLEQADAARSRRLRGGNTVSIFTSPRPVVEMLAEMLEQEGVPSIIQEVGSSASLTAAAPRSPAVAELLVLERDAQVNAELLQELIAELAAQSARD